MPENKKTALYKNHEDLHAKIIPFGGWLMPVSYSSVIEEHHAVRQKVGVFDVSHMGEIRVKGAGASAFLQHLTINDITALSPGRSQYSAICTPSGGILDDLFVYQLGQDDYLLCVNASNISKDWEWIRDHARSAANVQVINESDDWCQLAIQGPSSFAALESVISEADFRRVQRMNYTDIVSLKLWDETCWLARTGYTGEKGCEIFLPSSIGPRFWELLFERNTKLGIAPIGLGARDTLRLEACYLLYGNDMNEQVTPLEASIGWATKLEAKDFIGRDAMLKMKKTGVPRQIYGFKMTEPGIGRHDMAVFKNGKNCGVVTSGSFLPTLDFAGGLLLASAGLKPGDAISVDIRGNKRAAQIIKKPLYQAKAKD